jgi:hypothetical protein
MQTHGDKKWVQLLRIPGSNPEIVLFSMRWKDTLMPNINQANARTGKYTAVEDIKLKDAIQTYGIKNWVQLQRWFRVERKHSVGADDSSAV